MRAATVEGSPNTPLPMIEFTTSATRLQRPMARTRSWLRGSGEGGCIIARLYHKRLMLGQQSDWGDGLHSGLGQPRACPELVEGRLSLHGLWKLANARA